CCCVGVLIILIIIIIIVIINFHGVVVRISLQSAIGTIGTISFFFLFFFSSSRARVRQQTLPRGHKVLHVLEDALHGAHAGGGGERAQVGADVTGCHLGQPLKVEVAV